jgi:hypothetical protein
MWEVKEENCTMEEEKNKKAAASVYLSPTHHCNDVTL